MMGRSMSRIDLGLLALVFMVSFLNIDAQNCESAYYVGESPTFTYSNSSAEHVLWRLLTVNGEIRTSSCFLKTKICYNHDELGANATPEKSVLIIKRMRSHYKSLYVNVDGVESPWCSSFNVIGDPKGCISTYYVGQAANFTYFNSSALNVEWRLLTWDNGNRTSSCDLYRNTCSSNLELLANAIPGKSDLIIKQMRSHYRSLYVVVDGVESPWCSSFTTIEDDFKGCISTYYVGQAANFTYSNSSALSLEWRLLTWDNGNRTSSCELSGNTCSNNVELWANTIPGTSEFIIKQMQYNYRSLYVFVDGVESPWCRSFNIIRDGKSCSSTYRVGQSATFIFSNNSAVQVGWRLLTWNNDNRTSRCDLNSKTCYFYSDLWAYVTPGKFFLLIQQIQTNYRSLYVEVDGVEFPWCSSFKVIAQPENFTCAVRQSGSSNPIIRFNATKIYPNVADVTYFMSNGTAVNHTLYNGRDQSISTATGTLPYFYAGGEAVVESRFLRHGANRFFINMKSGDAPDPGVNCSLPSIDIYPVIANFTVNGNPYPVAVVPLQGTVNLACMVGPVPAETISLSRRGTGTRLNATGTGTSVTYVIQAFGGSDLDEYECTVDNGQWSNASKINISIYCKYLSISL
ncbi:unnamed protein product [Lymnaea stagnalis]|uniref:Ig-like domain-containing protein n=1 Tax=Lymnaea stagnalis TaxID=6523 RepID=A0AAV2I722_LYMST